MEDAPPPCRILPWDSEFFGRTVARVSVPVLTAAAADDLFSWCRARSVEGLYLLCDADDDVSVGSAERNGFGLVDVRVTLAGGSETLSGDRRQGERGRVRPAKEEDLPRLRDIARASHRESRFFHDPEIPAGRAADLFAVWIEKSVGGWAGAVFVFEEEGEARGYITCHDDSPGGGGRIGLFAVGERFRGAGIGRALLSAAGRWYSGRELSPVTVVTQGRNIKAQALYQKSGFRTASVGLWFHKWFQAESGG